MIEVIQLDQSTPLSSKTGNDKKRPDLSLIKLKSWGLNKDKIELDKLSANTNQTTDVEYPRINYMNILIYGIINDFV